MTTDIRNTYARYLEIKSQIDELQHALEPLKNQIIAYHNGRDTVSEDGFESMIVHGNRDTFIKENLLNHFGGVIPEEYIRRTQYDSLRVKQING